MGFELLLLLISNHSNHTKFPHLSLSHLKRRKQCMIVVKFLTSNKFSGDESLSLHLSEIRYRGHFSTTVFQVSILE